MDFESLPPNDERFATIFLLTAPAGERLEALLQGVDALRLGAPLQWEMVDAERGTVLTDRRRRIDDAVRSGRFPPISNCLELEPHAGHKIVVSGGTLPEFSDRASGPLRLTITLQERSAPVYAAAEKVLAIGADAVQAWYGTLTPNITDAELNRQLFAGPVRGTDREDPLPPLGLRTLELFPRPPLDPPIPKLIGWINYWSEETARRLDFPDPARDAAWLRLSYQTRSGAWMVKLTAEPLDLRLGAHRQAIADAYRRFDKLGAHRD